MENNVSIPQYTGSILSFTKIKGFKIKQGDSGMPVFDSSRKKIIGIVVAKEQKGNELFTYIFPADQVKKIITSLLKSGNYQHKALGIQGKELTYKDTYYPGVLVTEIAPESVASKILVKGDIIRKFNGETITTLHDLSISLFETTLDQNSLTLIRDSEEMIVQVNL